MNPQQEQLDPSIIALTKAIGHQESGGDYTKVGDNGHSVGAYQWNNPTPLKNGEIPKNFSSYAHDVGIDPNDFSPENQDRVAYKTIEKWGKEGLTPAQIASKWNSGKPDAYKTAKPGYNAEQGVNYDVGAYVNNVAKYFNEYSGNSNTSNASQPNNPPKRKTFAEELGVSTQQAPTDLKADISQTNPTVDALSNITPGSTLAKGLGYAISNEGGTQEGLIKANQRNIDTQTQLLQRIKENKANGKDTSKLESALNDITEQIKNTSGQVGDVGTGGITNKDVLKSAGALASLPVLATAGTVIKGLLKGGSALSNPVVKTALENAIGKGETISSLSRQEAIDALTTHLKDMSISSVGGEEEQVIQKALKELAATAVEKQNLLASLASKGLDVAKYGILTKLLGNTVGGFIHNQTK